MQKYRVSDIRWATIDDMNLPFWINWNQDHCRSYEQWSRVWEYPYICSRIPASGRIVNVGETGPRFFNSHFLNSFSTTEEKIFDLSLKENQFEYSCCISDSEDVQQFFSVLREMIRITRTTMVVSVKVSDVKGLPRFALRELESILGIRIPNIPYNSFKSTSKILRNTNQNIIESEQHIRVLGFTLESCDSLRSVAIMVPHWESWMFLKPCVEAIRKNTNSQELSEKIYILDDMSNDGSYERAKELYKDDQDIEILRLERPNKNQDADVGLLLDMGLKHVNEQYVVMMDADAFPLRPYWISFPIWLIEKYSCSSVGADSGLSIAYAQCGKKKSWWQASNGYEISSGLYDNEWFTCTNNFYRVMPTSLAKIVSENIGFARGTSENWAGSMIQRVSRRLRNILNFNCIKNRGTYLHQGCDNGVAANHFIDINRFGPKFNLPITSFIGHTPHDGVFGQNICGLLFHFALSTRALSTARREVHEVGEQFSYWVNKLSVNNEITSGIISELVEKSTNFAYKENDSNDSSGFKNYEKSSFPQNSSSIPASWYQREYGYIQSLLADYKRQGL